MATTKTTEEQLKEIDERIEQMKARKRQIQNRAKAENQQAHQNAYRDWWYGCESIRA